MILLLRQSNVKIGTVFDRDLKISEACFLRVEYAEIFDHGIEFLPSGEKQEHMFVSKTVDGDWLEPNTGISYDFVFLYSDDVQYELPRQLGIANL